MYSYLYTEKMRLFFCQTVEFFEQNYCCSKMKKKTTKISLNKIYELSCTYEKMNHPNVSDMNKGQISHVRMTYMRKKM